MTQNQALQSEWTALSQRYAAEHDGVEIGRMMSAQALTYLGRVFAFHSTKGGGIGLGCRLGRDFPFADLKLNDWRHLAPFKTKPPMKDWIVVGEADVGRWPELLDLALSVAKNRKE